MPDDGDSQATLIPQAPHPYDPKLVELRRHQALEWALAFHAGKTQNFTIVLETAKAFEAYLEGAE